MEPFGLILIAFPQDCVDFLDERAHPPSLSRHLRRALPRRSGHSRPRSKHLPPKPDRRKPSGARDQSASWTSWAQRAPTPALRRARLWQKRAQRRRLARAAALRSGTASINSGLCPQSAGGAQALTKIPTPRCRPFVKLPCPCPRGRNQMAGQLTSGYTAPMGPVGPQGPKATTTDQVLREDTFALPRLAGGLKSPPPD